MLTRVPLLCWRRDAVSSCAVRSVVTAEAKAVSADKYVSQLQAQV
jgi:hypothetical protein